MRKFLAILWLNLLGCISFSFASNPAIVNQSYVTNWDNVTIYWTDVSDWWYVDVSIQDPDTQEWIHIWTVDIKDQEFSYMRQWQSEQKILLEPDNWGDSIQVNIWNGVSKSSTSNSEPITRTVISSVPKTWPSGSLIWIIVATLMIFGGYIYIKKRADI